MQPRITDWTPSRRVPHLLISIVSRFYNCNSFRDGKSFCSSFFSLLESTRRVDRKLNAILCLTDYVRQFRALSVFSTRCRAFTFTEWTIFRLSRRDKNGEETKVVIFLFSPVDWQLSCSETTYHLSNRRFKFVIVPTSTPLPVVARAFI